MLHREHRGRRACRDPDLRVRVLHVAIRGLGREPSARATCLVCRPRASSPTTWASRSVKPAGRVLAALQHQPARARAPVCRSEKDRLRLPAIAEHSSPLFNDVIRPAEPCRDRHGPKMPRLGDIAVGLHAAPGRSWSSAHAGSSCRQRTSGDRGWQMGPFLQKGVALGRLGVAVEQVPGAIRAPSGLVKRVFRRRRFADLISRQLDLFSGTRLDDRRVRQAERSYNAAPRDEAEERYGDYMDLVETGTELLADLRDHFARTLDDDAAETTRTSSTAPSRSGSAIALEDQTAGGFRRCAPGPPMLAKPSWRLPGGRSDGQAGSEPTSALFATALASGPTTRIPARARFRCGRSARLPRARRRLAADDRRKLLVDRRRHDQVDWPELVFEEHEDDPVRGRRAAGGRRPGRRPQSAACGCSAELRARGPPPPVGAARGPSGWMPTRAGRPVVGEHPLPVVCTGSAGVAARARATASAGAPRRALPGTVAGREASPSSQSRSRRGGRSSRTRLR